MLVDKIKQHVMGTFVCAKTLLVCVAVGQSKIERESKIFFYDFDEDF